MNYIVCDRAYVRLDSCLVSLWRLLLRAAGREKALGAHPGEAGHVADQSDEWEEIRQRRISREEGAGRLFFISLQAKGLDGKVRECSLVPWNQESVDWKESL